MQPAQLPKLTESVWQEGLNYLQPPQKYGGKHWSGSSFCCFSGSVLLCFCIRVSEIIQMPFCPTSSPKLLLGDPAAVSGQMGCIIPQCVLGLPRGDPSSCGCAREKKKKLHEASKGHTHHTPAITGSSQSKGSSMIIKGPSNVFEKTLELWAGKVKEVWTSEVWTLL